MRSYIYIYITSMCKAISTLLLKIRHLIHERKVGVKLAKKAIRIVGLSTSIPLGRAAEKRKAEKAQEKAAPKKKVAKTSQQTAQTGEAEEWDEDWPEDPEDETFEHDEEWSDENAED